jgi:Fic family protein
MKSVHFSYKASVFQGLTVPEEGSIEGYAAILHAYQLNVPLPSIISLISTKNRKYKTSSWSVLTPKHKPEDSLYGQLIFAFKYEGLNLLLLKKLFEVLEEEVILELLQAEPSGQYSRKIWFLYEWLMHKKLKIPDADTKIKYSSLVDEKLQYAIANGEKSARHRITNNLPGTPDFCPLIRKTTELEAFIASNLTERKTNYLKNIHKDVLQRASAFLLLKDSKASFSIEGESPKSQRAARWGKAIGQAGMNNLSKEELLRLQQVVIASKRFVDLGYRQKGGFVGEHDRESGEPMPDHISARWQDLETLVKGLIETSEKLIDSDIDAVVAATIIAFGFVFIHPFEDGNGRIHRYLIHHVLAKKKFSQQGIIFPVSASILNHINDYRKILESYSQPLLDFIEWKETKDHNVEVLNETIDYYRYFDATQQCEFLYNCVKDTIENIIPEEINYLTKYDIFKRFLENEFDMPDKSIALLVRFLEQNKGKLSNRALSKEFSALAQNEISEIENHFKSIFLNE